MPSSLACSSPALRAASSSRRLASIDGMGVALHSPHDVGQDGLMLGRCDTVMTTGCRLEVGVKRVRGHTLTEFCNGTISFSLLPYFIQLPGMAIPTGRERHTHGSSPHDWGRWGRIDLSEEVLHRGKVLPNKLQNSQLGISQSDT